MIGGMAGCIVQQPEGTAYVDPGKSILGNPGQVTMYDLESSVQRLIQKMLAHPQFARNYDAVKAAKGGKLPIVCLGLLENNTGSPEARSRLRAANDTIRAMLFDSARFEVKDDEAADALKDRIIRGAVADSETAERLVPHDL